MSVSFIQRSAAKGTGGTITLPQHNLAAGGDLQMLAVSCFAGIAAGTPSGSGWTQLSVRSNAYSRLTIFMRLLPSGEVSSTVTIPASDYTNVELRTYRTTAGESFVVNGSGDGLVAADTTVNTWLVRCWASAQANTSGGSTKTLTPPAGLLNAPASTSYNWYDGGLFGDDPAAAGAAAGTSTAVHSGGTEPISPQWANVFVQPIDITGASVTGLAAAPLDSGARVTWNPTMGAASYDYRVNGGAPTEVTTTSTTVTGLTNGTAYTIEVRPKNSTSTGTWASTTVTPAAYTFYDDFNRPDSTSSPGSPAQGGPYTVVAGTWGIAGGALYTSASTAESMITFPGLVDADLTLTVSAFGTNGGLMFRYVDANNTWLVNFTTTQISLWRRSGGSWQQKGNTWAKAPVAGDVIRLLTVGRTIFVYRNGVEILNAEDDYVNVATATMGFRMSSETNTRLDKAVLVPGALATSTADLVIPDRIPTDPTYGQGHLYKGRDTKLADQGAVA